jgi:hypothetical protein
VVNDFPDVGVKSVYPDLWRSVLAHQEEAKLGWLDSRRERKRLKRERAGPSPEKLAERHAPGETAVDRMLRLGGVDREGRFKSD